MTCSTRRQGAGSPSPSASGQQVCVRAVQRLDWAVRPQATQGSKPSPRARSWQPTGGGPGGRGTGPAGLAS
eukprot:10235006-Lingulodinium_polyedra.AAC.1